MAADPAEGSDREGAEWTSTLPASNWRPPRAGAVLAIAIVAAGCWLIADAIGTTDSLAIAAAGAVGLAGVVWLAERDRFAALWTAIGVAVAPLAGGLLFAGVSYVLIAQLAGFAPSGSAFVGIGVVVAAFGAVSIPGDSADRERIAAATRNSVIAAVLLVAVAGGLVANAVRRESEIEPFEALPLPEELPSLLPETALTPPLGSALLVISLSLLALRSALAALPVAELLDDRSAENGDALQWFERLIAALNYAWLGVIAGAGVFGIRSLAGESYLDLWLSLPSFVAGLLGWVATAGWLRWLATRLLVVSLAAVVLVRVIRRVHRSGIGKHLGRVGLLVGVAAALSVGWFGHEAILNGVLTRLEGALPASVSAVVLEQADAVIDYYTGEVVALGLIALGGLWAAGALVALRLGTLFGAVPRRHSGHALASAGLLLTGGVGAALDAPLAHALVVIVAAVVVWDLGRFGIGLGRDVGRRAPSLPVQFVRVLTAALVGGVTAALGLAAASTTMVSLTTQSAAALALFVAVGAAVLASLSLAR